MACQVLEWLITDPQGIYVDCTLGGGGHSAALLEALGERCLVVGLDRDPDALQEASTRLSREVRRQGWCHTASFYYLVGVIERTGSAGFNHELCGWYMGVSGMQKA